jgi:hypothetical protein
VAGEGEHGARDFILSGRLELADGLKRLVE